MNGEITIFNFGKSTKFHNEFSLCNSTDFMDYHGIHRMHRIRGSCCSWKFSERSKYWELSIKPWWFHKELFIFGKLWFIFFENVWWLALHQEISKAWIIHDPWAYSWLSIICFFHPIDEIFIESIHQFHPFFLCWFSIMKSRCGISFGPGSSTSRPLRNEKKPHAFHRRLFAMTSCKKTTNMQWFSHAFMEFAMDLDDPKKKRHPAW